MHAIAAHLCHLSGCISRSIALTCFARSASPAPSSTASSRPSTSTRRRATGSCSSSSRGNVGTVRAAAKIVFYGAWLLKEVRKVRHCNGKY